MKNIVLEFIQNNEEFTHENIRDYLKDGDYEYTWDNFDEFKELHNSMVYSEHKRFLNFREL